LNYTFSSIVEKNHISSSFVVNIFDQYVDMKPVHLPRILSLDEFYLIKTRINKFASIFIDWQTSQIIDIYPNRKKYDFYSYMQYINKGEFKNVQYVIIDMNTTYRDFAYHHFKKCTVMVDSFHVAKNINETLKNLRIHIIYKFKRDSTKYYLLKHWNFLLMMREGDVANNLPKFNKKIDYMINKPQILKMILEIDPVLKKHISGRKII